MSGGGSNPQRSTGANPKTWATSTNGVVPTGGATEITVNGARFTGTVTANGQTDDFDIRDITSAMASCQVGTPSGTTPTLAVFLDVKDIFGNYLTVLTFTPFAGSAAYTYLSVGPGTANTYALTEKARFRWTIGGTASPTYPGCGFALCGR